MTKFNYEFILLFKYLGKALAEGMKAKNIDSPKFENMADESEYIENPFLSALFYGLSDGCFDKKLARNITFVKTHSKSTITMLTHTRAY